MELIKEEYEELKIEILYVGMFYIDSWGYKKVKFLNYFIDFDFYIYGNDDWERWFKDFLVL